MLSMLPVCLCVLPVVAGQPAGDAARLPIVIRHDGQPGAATDMSWLNDHRAGDHGFVHVKDGRFHHGEGRVRFWGVNVCFGANFPEKSLAPDVARQLSAMGVNVVRFHHHDNMDAPNGIWAKDTSPRTFDPDMLDRQDYFLDQLHRHGIYANLNPHVSRELNRRDGFDRTGLGSATTYDKFLMYFHPQVQAALKDFCRQYLLHENPYRKLRRVDDPGIAMIEITNENRFTRDGPQTAAALPPAYRQVFVAAWNQWLKQHYGNTDALRTAWDAARQPLGDPVAELNTVDTAKAGGWHLNQQSPARVEMVSAAGPVVRLHIIDKAAASWHQELMRTGLTLRKGSLYTLSFRARSDQPRPLYLDVSNQGPNHWSPQGYSETLKLTEAWQEISRTFAATADNDGHARICFKFGGSDVSFELADLTFRPGGAMQGLPQGQTLEQADVDIPLGHWSPPAQADVRQFMRETETAFLRDMVHFLRDELGVKVPITGSQLAGYSDPHAIADTCDYADAHAYWQHPIFPNKPWDRGDWLVTNTPMEARPGECPLLHLAAVRLLDRPYTVSEWNIPAPIDYNASTAPFAAAVAGLQDWDAVYFFDYHSSSRNWFSDRIQNFFSLSGHPVQTAMVAACAPLFRRGDLPALTPVRAGTLDDSPPSAEALRCRIGVDPAADRPSTPADVPDSRSVV